MLIISDEPEKVVGTLYRVSNKVCEYLFEAKEDAEMFAGQCGSAATWHAVADEVHYFRKGAMQPKTTKEEDK